MSQTLSARSGEERREATRPWQFSLDTLLLLTTLIAVMIGITLALPPLGVALSLLSAGAFYRTLVACRLRLDAAEPMNCIQKVASFFGSVGWIVTALCVGVMGLVITMILGGIIVGSIVSFVNGPGPSSGMLEAFSYLGFFLVSLLGLSVAGYIVGVILWESRPR